LSSRKSLESTVAGVGTDLARTFRGVLNAIPGGPHRPQWLARSLGVNTVLTSRILKVAQQQDPLAVAHMIPGPEPLRRLLRAAEKKKVDPEVIREARAAVDRFEQLIDSVAGDRSALDAIISGWLPDAREKVELLAKQSVFRGISQLLGTACDVEHHTLLLYPTMSADGRADTAEVRADSLWLTVSRGLRRLRPGLPVRYDIHSTAPMLTVTGQPLEQLAGLMLEQFCSSPLPTFKVTHLRDKTQCLLAGDDVGVQSAIDLVHATVLLGGKEMHRSPGEPPRKTAMSVGISMPSKTIIFDVLLHEDVYPGQQPTLYLYQTLAAGVAHPDDRGRDMDRLDVLESIQTLGAGITKFRSTDTPGYRDMLRYVCDQRGWDGEKLRGFRCRVEYPIYSSQIMMGFDLPPHPQKL
jgi:hypothetical protein